MTELVGKGLYTPAEASRLLGIPAAKISRWLRGHFAHGKQYNPLWSPEIHLDDGSWSLGFRDLMELRVAAAFLEIGISPQQVRKAISIAQELIENDHPLATNRFKTDGRDIFFHIVESDQEGNERDKLLNLFRRQFEFKGIIDPILKSVDFAENDVPRLWWPAGRQKKIVVDPARAFGQPIDAVSSVPTSILAKVASSLGISETAKAYEVEAAAVKRAIEYESKLELRLAA